MPNKSPALPDPDGTAQRVALEIMALDPERRLEAVTKAGDMFATLAEADGCSPVDATVFALAMQRRIQDAIRAIEISGGSAGGRG
jgi:hypothetical protein